MEKHIVNQNKVINKLYLTFDRITPLNAGTDRRLAYSSLGNSTPKSPWKNINNYRIPWANIEDRRLRGMNFFVTVNPDPNVDWYVGDTHKPTIIVKFLNLIEDLTLKQIIKKSISIYEYGKYGKTHGKLHFHMLMKCTDRCQFFSETCKIFNKRSNCRHRTIDIRCVKSVKDRTQILQYFKKEAQNSKKCLYIN